MELTPPDDPGAEDADFSEVQAHDEAHLDQHPRIDREYDPPPMPHAAKTGWLQACLKVMLGNVAGFVMFAVAVVSFAAFIVIPHWLHPTPPAPAREDVLTLDWANHKAEYEAAFWRGHADVPIIATVTTPGGTMVVGRIRFMENCPTGVFCAEPDGRVIDVNGDDVLAAEADAAGDAAEAAYERR